MPPWLQISQQREELLKRQEAAADEARAVSVRVGGRVVNVGVRGVGVS